MISIKNISRFAALLALCLALNYLESLLFAVIPLPIPGCRLGLSNAVVLYLIGQKNPRGAYLLALLRALFNFTLFGGAVGALFSVCGGLISVTVMCIFAPLLERGYSFFSLSVFGSLFFQVGQSFAAVILYGFGILYLLPVLLSAGLISGALLGILQNYLFLKMKTVDKSA